MDNKTMQRVINGQEDKLQNLNKVNDRIDKDISILDNKVIKLEQKANRTGQFHLDAINDKFAKQKETNQIFDDSLTDLQKQINKLDNICVEQYDLLFVKIAELEKKISDFVKHTTTTKYNNDYKKLWEENTKYYNDLSQHRLNDYTKGVKNSKDSCFVKSSEATPDFCRSG